MGKKNYISREEYKLWEYVKDKEIVDIGFIKEIFPDMLSIKRDKILHNLYKKGYLQRAKKGLYYNPLLLKNFYKLALTIKEGYIGLSSALRYYNLIEYEDFTIFVITQEFQKKIQLKGTKYEIQYIPLKKLFIGTENCGIEKREGIYISSIEKTFFDCFLKPRNIGFSNITKALYETKIDLDKSIDWNKFIGFFKLTNNNALHQRTGYILELMKKDIKLKIPSFVFEFLLKRVKKPVKLIPTKGKSIYNNKWKVQDNLGKENILSW